MSSLNILVVDDNPDLAESIGEALGLAGHNVRLASNGAEAVARFSEMKYDLCFIDVRMPVMNGVDCFFAVRERHPDARIVLMTGFKEPAVERALSAGALALLHKPFRMEEVIKIARQIA
jgi:two-component system chemotaxis response regulator CheY